MAVRFERFYRLAADDYLLARETVTNPPR